MAGTGYSEEFLRAVELGRPPSVKRLFPNSRALLVSGRFIDRAMLEKGGAMTIAANARNHIIIRGVLAAAQRAGAAVIIEIARSEGGTSAYCATNYWNMARQVDAVCNELGITVPVALHADHYGIKKPEDVPVAEREIPTLFEAGLTSIAIDASHMPDDENLLANIALNRVIPDWAGLETEVGEIKGKQGLSTVDEALFLIRGLNAHGIFPDWIALNNGTTHGIQASDQGIQVGLTAEIHEALGPYRVSGAQHGTSGNNSDRLREIAATTRTTKANVATALQMISWGVEVDDYGNAVTASDGSFKKIENAGVLPELWREMVAYADRHGWSGGNFKRLNLPFEAKIMAQPLEIRERMARGVEEFVYNLLVNVFNAEGTGDIAVRQILDAGSHDPGPKAERMEQPEEWTEDEIRRKASMIESDKGPAGDFDD